MSGDEDNFDEFQSTAGTERELDWEELKQITFAVCRSLVPVEEEMRYIRFIRHHVKVAKNCYPGFQRFEVIITHLRAMLRVFTEHGTVEERWTDAQVVDPTSLDTVLQDGILIKRKSPPNL